MRSQLREDDVAQYQAVQDRLRRLEAAVLKRSFVVSSPISSLDLGPIDGENITAVRITFAGKVSDSGGDTWLRLRPNGIASLTASHFFDRTYSSGSPTYPLTHDVLGGGAPVTGIGLVIGGTNWSAANLLDVTGTFFIRRGPNYMRHWHGTFSNQDYISDSNNRLGCTMFGIWYDSTTIVSSITLALDAGTFVGQGSVEIVP